MFENEKTYQIATKDGMLGYQELTSLIPSNENISGSTWIQICEDCNFPGGDVCKIDKKDWAEKGFVGVDTLTEHKQTKPCTQSDKEKSRCPKHFATFRDLVCSSGRCDSMKCKKCESSARIGALKIGDILLVTGEMARDVKDQRGNDVQVMVAQRRCGRYLGLEPSGMLRFELMELKKGMDQKSGYRFWISPGRCFMEDLDERAREILSSIEEGRSTNIVLPDDFKGKI